MTRGPDVDPHILDSGALERVTARRSLGEAGTPSYVGPPCDGEFMIAISIVALVFSGFALPFTIWAARAAAKQARAAHDQTDIQREQVAAAREQTQLQRDLAREALQPYVWADIQPDMQQGSYLQVVVGNNGPAVAQNVRVTFDPPLPAGELHSESVEGVQRVLKNGLRSLAPNRIIRWSLGVASDLLSSESPQVRTVRVEGDGPYGPLPVLEMEIDVSEWRQARDAPDGSLHHVRGAVKELVKSVAGVDKTVRRAVDRMDQPTPVTVELKLTREDSNWNQQEASLLEVAVDSPNSPGSPQIEAAGE